ncbi:hypothetical protein OH786_00165 [Streptomyces atratus]|uniref:hypothetical protein n=1 Tax=Streptomyces atratus TaxID=1893 RepID=UPI0015A52A9E|nr:hypothetical protein [Streptomyces atratus]
MPGHSRESAPGHLQRLVSKPGLGYGNTAATGWAPEFTAQWNSTDNLVITD